MDEPCFIKLELHNKVNEMKIKRLKKKLQFGFSLTSGLSVYRRCSLTAVSHLNSGGRVNMMYFGATVKISSRFLWIFSGNR